MNKAAMNKEWHSKHLMPRNATVEQRVAWHRAHLAYCACRGVPESLRAYFEDGAEARRYSDRRSAGKRGAR